MPYQESRIYIDEFEVCFKRKRVKTMRMRVVPPYGVVEISAPLRMPQARVEEFVRTKRSWIVRQQEKMRDSPRVVAELASEKEKQEWRQMVAAFVPALVEKWAPALGVVPGKLAYRNMRSRWGSCQPETGRICINTRLALYPPECLEYVVVHELCHLRVGAHNAQFWALVESCLPNYKHAIKLLNE